jgi:hypothetical protein
VPLVSAPVEGMRAVGIAESFDELEDRQHASASISKRDRRTISHPQAAKKLSHLG